MNRRDRISITTEQSTIIPTMFQEYDAKYKCCCDLVHVKNGVIVFSILEIVALGSYNAIMIIRDRVDEFDISRWRIGGLLISFIQFIITVVMLFGLLQEAKYPKLLVPHFVLKFFVITFYVFVSYTGVVTFLSNHDYLILDEKDVNALTTVGLYSAAAVFEIWYLHVVFVTYRYLKDKCRYEYRNTVRTPIL